MQVILGMASTRTSSHLDSSWLDTHAADVVPFPGYVDGVARWVAPSGRIELRSWDNGPQPTGPALVGAGDRALAITGYVHDRGRVLQPLELLDRLSDQADPTRLISSLGGCFSLLVVSHDKLCGWTSRGRLDALFHASDATAVAVASRPLTAHLALRGAAGPALEPRFAAEVVSAGLPAGTGSPFQGVHQLPERDWIEVLRGEVRLRPSQFEAIDEPRSATVRKPSRWFPSRRPDADVPDPNQVIAASDALTSAIAPIAAASSLQVSLTGGKDSRLTAALLHRAGLEFSSATRGLEDHPDVIVAREIAGLLGVRHQSIPPPVVQGAIEVDVAERIAMTLRSSDGMHHGYEGNITALPGARSDRIALGGAGGEVLRGGLARDATLDSAAVRKNIRWHWMQGESFLTPDAAADREQSFKEWIEHFHTDPPAEAQAWYHRDIRLGRWNMAGRLCHGGSALTVQPFLDSAVIAAAWKVPIEQRSSERFFHAVLAYLSPELAELPLADNHWRFQRPANRSRRSGSPPFSWRQQLSGPLGDALFTIIDDALLLENLSDVIQRGQVEQFRTRVQSGEFDQRETPARRLWALASMAMLWSGSWQTPGAASLTIRIPIPANPA